MRIASTIAIFIVVAPTAALAFIAACFAFWSVVPMDIEKTTAAMLFVFVAPSIGIVTGSVVALRHALRAGQRPEGVSPAFRWSATLFAAFAGWLCGQIVALPFIVADNAPPGRPSPLAEALLFGGGSAGLVLGAVAGWATYRRLGRRRAERDAGGRLRGPDHR